ncbi:hypothetical protein [Seonamhaeicola marinus]|uniref:Uncharacterized protein n=1 Tax=Seonamhaeicola marinus TaxID=1912246 RepID=A0A5D0I4D8_9FLAO|nr:hypothetical protein [Seonamhaeicola marinus]TYA78534.1 hypothetical protein FUA24_09265 [Seonamhaeicola marinus]
MEERTPEQKREIEKIYSELNKYWFLDYKTKEIRRRLPENWKQKLGNFFWKKRNTVEELFWWVDRYFANNMEATIVEAFPIKCDGMEIKGFPMKYKLSSGYKIPKKELKYLKNGPLANEALNEILVTHSIGWNKIVLIFKQYGWIVTTMVATATIIGRLIDLIKS